MLFHPWDCFGPIPCIKGRKGKEKHELHTLPKIPLLSSFQISHSWTHDLNILSHFYLYQVSIFHQEKNQKRTPSTKQRSFNIFNETFKLMLRIWNAKTQNMNPKILVLPKRRSAKRQQIRVSDSYGDEVFRLGSLRSKTAAFPLELDGEVS